MRDTIDMAREAGLIALNVECDPSYLPIIKRFEALVRADERDKWMERTAILIRGEREACAKVCDARYMGDNNREDMEAKRCAAAIRARGQA